MITRILSWFRSPPSSAEAPVPSTRTDPANDGTNVPAGAVLLQGGVDFAFEVVGQANYQRSLEAIHRDHAVTGTDCVLIAALIPERNNDYDANAIGVWICGLKVAHFSREDGKSYRRVIADVTSQGLAVCRACIREVAAPAAGDPASFRVCLDLAAPASLRFHGG